MWRYLVGGVAALLLVGAGWLIFNGEAHPDALPNALVAARPADAARQDDAGSAPLPEAPARSREQKRFDRYDKDRDGRITRDEYLVPRHKAFAKLDTNGDGRLGFDEWAIKTTTRFADADRDRSGAMDPAEFATTAPKRKSPRPACRCEDAPKQED
ncbi:MAG: EF-hand domain-containing protein [Sphingomonas phyllosphaerae]|uniref:EF-hand domain-containing protein n=1 Tax=Sphingomonas phyllosphaerae TaxID=257003 RepID=UPI002FFC44B4